MNDIFQRESTFFTRFRNAFRFNVPTQKTFEQYYFVRNRVIKIVTVRAKCNILSHLSTGGEIY